MEAAAAGQRRQARHAARDLRQNGVDRDGIEVRCRSHQPGGIGVARRGDDIGRRPLLDKSPCIQNGDPVGGFGNHAHIVGDQNDRGAALLAQPAQQRQHLRLNGDIKGCCRLVSDDQLRLGRQCQRNDDPLAHPAREFMRKSSAAFGIDPHFLQKLYRTRLGGITGQAEMKLDGLDKLITHGAKRIQAGQRILKDHTDLAAAH